MSLWRLDSWTGSPAMKKLTILFLVAMISGCTQVRVEDYAANQPQFLPREFFQGHLTAHGVVKDRSGRVARYFNADIEARWEEGVGQLIEDFTFDDGEQQRRIWTLSPAGESRYAATAGDVVGTGDLTFSGNTMFLDYVLRVAYGDGTVDLRVDDRMYLVSPDILINESFMSKFGLQVGSISLVIIRHSGVGPDENRNSGSGYRGTGGST
jgi:hypothetical protein